MARTIDKKDEHEIAKIKPYERNAKMHTPEQVALIARSIQEFGFNQPIVVDESGTILAGHGRYLAAKEIGIAKVPTWIVSGLTEAQKRAYRIADNKLNMDTQFDLGLLQLDIEDTIEELDLTEFLGDLGQFTPPDESEFPQKTEAVAKQVKYCTCPKCGENFPA